VRAVLVGIGQDNDFVVLQVVDVEVLFAYTGIQCGNKRADFLVGKHLVYTFALGVEWFAAQGQYCLESTVTSLLCTAACAVALYDEQLV